MQTFNLRVKADEDGVIRVEIPADSAEVLYDLVVVMQASQTIQNGDHEEIPPDGTAARMVYEAQKANIHSGQVVDASQLSETLQEDYADYLLNRMNSDVSDE